MAKLKNSKRRNRDHMWRRIMGQIGFGAVEVRYTGGGKYTFNVGDRDISRRVEILRARGFVETAIVPTAVRWDEAYTVRLTKEGLDWL